MSFAFDKIIMLDFYEDFLTVFQNRADNLLPSISYVIARIPITQVEEIPWKSVADTKGP